MRFQSLQHKIHGTWWMVFFTLLCYVVYEQSLRNYKQQNSQLSEQVLKLDKEKLMALERQKELMEQVSSQHDPAWIELTLMKELGLVPEGQKKVVFRNNVRP